MPASQAGTSRVSTFSGAKKGSGAGKPETRFDRRPTESTHNQETLPQQRTYGRQQKKGSEYSAPSVMTNTEAPKEFEFTGSGHAGVQHEVVRVTGVNLCLF